MNENLFIWKLYKNVQENSLSASALNLFGVLGKIGKF